MAKRLHPQARAAVYGLIAERDGDKCSRCAKPASKKHLCIDHKNGDSDDWAPGNLRLLCHSCNDKEGYRLRRQGKSPSASDSADVSTVSTPATKKSERGRVSGRERAGGREGEGSGKVVSVGASTDTTKSWQALKNAVDYEDGSAEMRANLRYEDKYRWWVMQQVRTRVQITRKEAIYGGAEFAGCSVQTAERYLGKMTSSVGPLREMKDLLMVSVIVLRGTPPGPAQPTG